MKLISWTIVTTLLASSGCAVFGGVVDSSRRDSSDPDRPRSGLGPCAWTKAGSVADVILTGLWIGLAVHSAREEPPDHEYTAIFAADAAITTVSAIAGFAGYTCQDGYLFGRGKPEEPIAAKDDSPLERDRAACANGNSAGCVRLFNATNSVEEKIAIGAPTCGSAPEAGLCDDVATLVQANDPARAEGLLQHGCAADGYAADDSCVALGKIDATRTTPVPPYHAASREKCRAGDRATCSELGRGLVGRPALAP